MLSNEAFKEIRQEWVATLKSTDTFKSPDSFSIDWKSYYKALPKARNVLTVVSRASGIPVRSLQGDNQEPHVTAYRHMVIYICIEYLEMSKSRAGRVVNRDHSTASYALETFKDRLDRDGRWRKSLEKVLRALA